LTQPPPAGAPFSIAPFVSAPAPAPAPAVAAAAAAPAGTAVCHLTVESLQRFYATHEPSRAAKAEDFISK
jgi:hypothetical protein